MKRHNAVFTAAVVIFLISFVFCLQAPSFARTINIKSWSGEMFPASENTTSLIKSNLLTAGGQRVLLKKSNRPYEITVDFDSLLTSDIDGTLTISNDEPKWLSVSVSDTNIHLPAGAHASATITVLRLDLDYTAETEQTTETSQTSASGGSETEIVPSGSGLETESASSSISSEAKTSASIGGFLTETTSEVTETTALLTSGVPDNLTFSLTFTSGNIVISGMFTVSTTDYSIELDDEYDDLPNGAIVRCSSWYGKEHPVFIELDNAARVRYSIDGSSPGYFPPMTRYEINGEKTLLYNGGYIIAKETGTIVIDMSYTDVQGQIGLHTESSDHLLESAEFPKLLTQNGMIIADDNEKVVIDKYVLDEIMPEITTEKLVKDENDEFVWEETNALLINEDPYGAVALTALDAPAGTYKIKLKWIFSDHLLYSIEAEVFVRYSEWQGGISE